MPTLAHLLHAVGSWPCAVVVASTLTCAQPPMLRLPDEGRAIIAPDLDGDGHRDILSNRLGLRVRSGRDLRILWDVRSPSPNAGLGTSFAVVADQDGDKLPDVLAGMPVGYALPLVDCEARLYSGKNGTLLHSFRGTPLSRFGWSVAGVDDLDGDGAEDILIGAPGDGPPIAAGAVRVFSGRSKQLLRTHKGTLMLQEFGSCLLSLGDVDGDGAGDYAVGTRTDRPSPQMYRAGSVTVYSGRSGVQLYKLWGSTPTDELGASLAALDDLDRDGAPDLAIGTRQLDPRYPGYIRITSGRTGRLLRRVDGDAKGDVFGLALSSIDDLDGDGIEDLVSGPARPPPARPSYVALISSRTGRSIARIAPDQDEVDLVGFAGAGGGDLDQDGSPDLVVGATRYVGSRYVTEVLIHSSRRLGLVAAPYQLPMRQVGVQVLHLDAGPAHAGRRYWMLGSSTGTGRGIQLSQVRVPLDADDYTTWTIHNPNSSLMPRSTGLLDAAGRARVRFRMPDGGPVLAPFTLHHAFVVFDRRGRVVYASNPVWLRLH